MQRQRSCKTIIAALLASSAAILIIASRARAELINLTPTTGANSTTSVPLSSLVSGQMPGIQVGDKRFSNFSYSRIGDMPTADLVNVLGFKDPDGNWGISFHGTFLDLPGGSASDALVRYVVEVDPAAAEQGFRISDAHVYLGGVGVGDGSFFTVDETFLNTNNSMSVYKTSLGQGGQVLHDSTFFDPVQLQLHVTKDIFAMAANTSNLPARATVIDQSFSQVPEPAAIALAAMGLVGTFSCVRRRTR